MLPPSDKKNASRSLCRVHSSKAESRLEVPDILQFARYLHPPKKLNYSILLSIILSILSNILSILLSITSTILSIISIMLSIISIQLGIISIILSILSILLSCS